jgi:hypothetical protein
MGATDVEISATASTSQARREVDIDGKNLQAGGVAKILEIESGVGYRVIANQIHNTGSYSKIYISG